MFRDAEYTLESTLLNGVMMNNGDVARLEGNLLTFFRDGRSYERMLSESDPEIIPTGRSGNVLTVEDRLGNNISYYHLGKRGIEEIKLVDRLRTIVFFNVTVCGDYVVYHTTENRHFTIYIQKDGAVKEKKLPRDKDEEIYFDPYYSGPHLRYVHIKKGKTPDTTVVSIIESDIEGEPYYYTSFVAGYSMSAFGFRNVFLPHNCFAGQAVGGKRMIFRMHPSDGALREGGKIIRSPQSIIGEVMECRYPRYINRRLLASDGKNVEVYVVDSTGSISTNPQVTLADLYPVATHTGIFDFSSSHLELLV